MADDVQTQDGTGSGDPTDTGMVPGGAQPPQEFGGPPKGTPDKRPSRGSLPKRPENTIFYELASIHPISDFDEVYFLELLEFSLSLSVAEKKRVVDAIPTLSQFQVDELHKVFEDEREEFKKLLSKEGEVIKDLVGKAKEGWNTLRGMYEDEMKEFEKQSADQAKMNELKNLMDEEN